MKKKLPLADQVKAYNVRDTVVIEIEDVVGFMRAERFSIDEAKDRLKVLRDNARVVIQKLETAIELAQKYQYGMVCMRCGATFGHHKLVGENCPKRRGCFKAGWRTCKFKRKEK